MMARVLAGFAGVVSVLALCQPAFASPSSEFAQSLQLAAVQVVETPATRNFSNGTPRPPQRVPQRVPSRS
jgi:hypothetical protein